jgi:Leucine Rich Repeat (LRR) protein
MTNGFALATLPVMALGCAIYAAWSLYQGWKEIRSRKGSKHRRREHPVAVAVQTGLFVVFSIALLMTGFSIFGRTAGQSPYAQWLKSVVNDTEESDQSAMARFDDLPGSFEFARKDPAHPVVGASLSHLPATDIDVARLADRFPEIEWLHLEDTEITDRSVDDLCRFDHLRMVVLSQTSISDQGLERLGHLRDLKELKLSQTQISDKGLRYLKNMPSLRALDLTDTKVTRKAVRKLRTRLPDCVIRFRKRA